MIIYLIAGLMIPFIILTLKWSKEMNQYSDLYQNKLSPKVPASKTAATEKYRSNPSELSKDVISGRITLQLFKMLFSRVEDQELKRAQSRARRALVYALVYLVLWFAVSGIILYLSNR